jgi:hypothetical protein
MARPQHPDQARAIAELRKVIAQHGEVVGPKVAKVKFVSIGASTWSRFVKIAREEAREADHAAQAGLPSSALASMAAAAGIPADQVEALPAAINWQAQIAAMLRQCDLIVRQSIHVDPATGQERVRNMVTLNQAIRTRCSVMELAHRRESVVMSGERFIHWERQLVDAVGSAIGRAGTEAERAIALRVVNAMREVVALRQAERTYVGGSVALAGGVT